MDIKIDHSSKRRDKRGFLVDFLKYGEVAENEKKLGQIYYVTFDKKGVIRGKHFHKERCEWFVVVKGKMKVTLKDLESQEEKKLILNGDSNKYRRLKIGHNILHTFECLSESAAMINYCDKPYDNNKPDTYIIKIKNQNLNIKIKKKEIIFFKL